MIFFQPVFFLFFGIFFPLYTLLRNRLALQNALILLGSYIFYGWWDVRVLILITVSTAVDYTFDTADLDRPLEQVLERGGWAKPAWGAEAKGALIVAGIGASAVVLVPLALLLQGRLG